MNSIADLQQKLAEFRDERNWKQFHDPINLAVAMQLEVSEVLECFQWRADKEVFSTWLSDAANRQLLTDEIADVFSYLLLLADSLDIDLVSALEHKMSHNATKYPIEKSKGNSKKYTEL